MKTQDTGDLVDFTSFSNRFEGHEDRVAAHIMRIRSDEEKIRAAGKDPNAINAVEADRIIKP